MAYDAEDRWTSFSLERLEKEKESLKVELLGRLGVSREQVLLSGLRSRWKDLAGPLAAHTSPERLEKGTLYVAVGHPAFANELQLYQRSIIEALGRENIAVVRLKHILKGDRG
ncbi:MAG: DUF721 domain-containing protein [Spirochaetales bacterium]|nr:DUF721 domain-containing protein [Spirochaetales bacterium]